MKIFVTLGTHLCCERPALQLGSVHFDPHSCALVSCCANTLIFTVLRSPTAHSPLPTISSNSSSPNYCILSQKNPCSLPPTVHGSQAFKRSRHLSDERRRDSGDVRASPRTAVSFPEWLERSPQTVGESLQARYYGSSLRLTNKQNE